MTLTRLRDIWVHEKKAPRTRYPRRAPRVDFG